MCLYFFAYECHPNYRLILAGNRDEFYHRPTEPAKFWDSHPWVLAGRDLEMMGTWMGVTKSGRFAALTNYRDPSLHIASGESRGLLVSEFLCSEQPPAAYLQKVAEKRERYNPFNLLVGNLEQLYYINRLNPEILLLEPGIYGLSNHLLDTPWPKVQKTKQALAAYLKNRAFVEPGPIFELLADTELAPDQDLPSTGISKEREKALSSVFIPEPGYGTRSSTVLLINRHNEVFFQEKTFINGREQGKEVQQRFDIVSVHEPTKG